MKMVVSGDEERQVKRPKEPTDLSLSWQKHIFWLLTMTKARTWMATLNERGKSEQLTALETKDIEHSSLMDAICFSRSEFFEESAMLRSRSFVSLRRLHETDESVLLQHDLVALGLKQLLLRFLELIRETNKHTW